MDLIHLPGDDEPPSISLLTPAPSVRDTTISQPQQPQPLRRVMSDEFLASTSNPRGATASSHSPERVYPRVADVHTPSPPSRPPRFFMSEIEAETFVDLPPRTRGRTLSPSRIFSRGADTFMHSPLRISIPNVRSPQRNYRFGSESRNQSPQCLAIRDREPSPDAVERELAFMSYRMDEISRNLEMQNRSRGRIGARANTPTLLLNEGYSRRRNELHPPFYFSPPDYESMSRPPQRRRAIVKTPANTGGNPSPAESPNPPPIPTVVSPPPAATTAAGAAVTAPAVSTATTAVVT